MRTSSDIASIFSFSGRNWQLLMLVALTLAFPLAIKTYFVTRIGIIIAIFAINIAGMTLLTRYAGVVSLGHAAFFASGAYLSAIFTVRVGLNCWLSMAMAAGITVAFAYLFAFPFLHLRRAYLAMATLGLGEVIFLLAKDLTNITGGVNGIPGIPYLTVGRIVLSEDWQVFYLIWGLAIFLIFLTENIGKTRLGRAFHAIRTNEIAAQAMGINVQRELSRVFCFSALVSALSGSMLAHFITFISPESFTLGFSFSLLVFVIIGGANIWGTLVTTIILTGVSEVLRGAQDYGTGLYGLLLIVALFFFPGGLAVLFPKAYTRRRANTLELLPQNAYPDVIEPIDTGKGVEGPKLTQNNILELVNISRYFGGTAALSNVSSSVGYHQIFGVIGPNGAGKTTLLNIINGFLIPQEGQVIFKNQDLTGKPPYLMARAGIGRTFQISNLFKGMTVVENIMVGCHIKGSSGMLMSGLNVGRAHREENLMMNSAMKSLEFLGLAHRAYDIVESLPYGEQKLVEMARALAMEPTLLLLDEPASGLNPSETRTLSNILRRVKQQGITIILVEHNMSLIMNVSDFILVLDFGGRIAMGTPEEVSNNEQVIRAYLGKETRDA